MKTFLLVLKLQLLGKVGVPSSVGEEIFLVLFRFGFFLTGSPSLFSSTEASR